MLGDRFHTERECQVTNCDSVSYIKWNIVHYLMITCILYLTLVIDVYELDTFDLKQDFKILTYKL